MFVPVRNGLRACPQASEDEYGTTRWVWPSVSLTRFCCLSNDLSACWVVPYARERPGGVTL